MVIPERHSQRTLDISRSRSLRFASLIRQCIHLLLSVGAVLHCAVFSPCAVNQVLVPSGPCCVDDCGDCDAAANSGASEECHRSHSSDDAGTCICKAKGVASVTHHPAIVGAVSIQPAMFVTVETPPLNAFSPAALTADSPPPDVGRGLPLLF